MVEVVVHHVRLHLHVGVPPILRVNVKHILLVVNGPLVKVVVVDRLFLILTFEFHLKKN